MTSFVLVILLILFFVGTFSDMLKYVMFFETIGTSLAAIAIFILRRKANQLGKTDIYTIKWYPLVPAVFVLLYWFVTVNIFISFKENPHAALWCLLAYAIGLNIYYLSAGKQGQVFN